MGKEVFKEGGPRRRWENGKLGKVDSQRVAEQRRCAEGVAKVGSYYYSVEEYHEAAKSSSIALYASSVANAMSEVSIIIYLVHQIRLLL